MLRTCFERWFATLLVAAFVLGTVCVLRQSIWSPRDEIAHFDYIEQLSSGHWPQAGEMISDRTFAMCLHDFDWPRPDDFDGTRGTMSVFAFSYEAWQPPLYYALMVLPNRALDWLDVSPTTRLVTLRLLTLGFVYAGLLMVVALFYELGKLGAVGREVGWLVALALAVTNLQHYFSLGNDNLAPLFGATFFWLHARHHRLGESRCLWWAAFVTGLGIWCKFSNGLLLVVHVVLCLLRPRAGALESTWRSRLATLVIPLGMAIALLTLNHFRFGEVLNISTTEERFAPRTVSTDYSPLFLTFLVHDSLLLIWKNGARFVAAHPRTLAWWWGFAATLAVNALLVLVCRLRGKWTARQGVVLLAVGITAMVVAAAAILNLKRPSVYWYNFRHFFAYAVPWFTAISLSGIALPPRIGTWVTALFGIAGTAVVVWFAWILLQ